MTLLLLGHVAHGLLGALSLSWAYADMLTNFLLPACAPCSDGLLPAGLFKEHSSWRPLQAHVGFVAD